MTTSKAGDYSYREIPNTADVQALTESHTEVRHTIKPAALQIGIWCFRSIAFES